MAEPAVTQPEPEPLPEVFSEYYTDTGTLVVHTEEKWSEGEDIARGLTVFYDAADHVLGFVLEGAELDLPAFVAAALDAAEE